MLIVQKYGGSSLADGERLRRAAQRVAMQVQRGHKLVVVVSAQGDTTERLLEKVTSPTPRELDAYLAAGEQMSAALMAMELEAQGISAVSLTGVQAGLLTHGPHGDACPKLLGNDRIRRELGNGNTVVVAGFQGHNAASDITTLGRGGSDTTAVALAAFLHADRCMIYTDVDGVYDKDPRKFPDAVRFDVIGYDVMLELARQGAQVLHHRCVELARQFGVAIEVLSSFRPGAGTLVTDGLSPLLVEDIPPT